jgi:hypothetical protein
MKKITVIIWLLVGLFVLQAPSVTYAFRYTFDAITSNSQESVDIGEAQLVVDVTDAGGGEDPASPLALFTFSNLGPEQSTIFEVYFDDGTLLDIDSIINAPPDVEFHRILGANNLPGGENLDPDFETTVNFSAKADSPGPKNGVNPYESLGILFTLQGTQTLQSVLNDLETGNLRIGIHVGNFANGESESFVNNPLPQDPNIPIPETSTGILLGLGLVGIFGLGKTFRKW